MEKYKNIINLVHPNIYNHERQSIDKRASQFAPFAALTGYEDEILETERIVDKEICLTEELKEYLDRKLNIINKNINNKPKVLITYFIKDNKKQGGKYITEELIIKKIDYIKKEIKTESKNIKIDDIINLELEK